MLRAFRRNVTVLGWTAALLTVFAAGCAPGAQPGITLGEWIVLLDEMAGIEQYDETTPYYVNVQETSPYFDSVQAAVEWNVLDISAPFDPYAHLTREWAAFTLMNLAERDLPAASGNSIRDIAQSRFPKQVSAAVSCGLMTLDKHDRFQPTKQLSKEEAIGYLEETVHLINHRTIDESYADIEWNDEITFVEDQPKEINPENGIAVFDRNTSVSDGQYIVKGNPNAPEAVYKVESVQETADSTQAVISPAKPEEMLDSLDTADSFTIDFNQATIVDEIDGMTLNPSEVTSYVSPTNTMVMANEVRSLRKTHTVKGYEITYSVTATGFKAEVVKETPAGLNVYGKIAVSGVKPAYRWNMKNGTIEDGYFCVDFTTTESLGARIGSYKNLYGDFSRIDPNSFLNTIQNLFQKRSDVAEIEIPLATITIPVPSAPVLSIVMQLQLRIYSSGKAELALTQNERIGMEIRNGKMREITDFDASAEATIRASTSLMGGLKTAMTLAGMRLADITAEAGAKALVTSTVHLYDSEGNHTVVDTDAVPSDMVDDLADGNGNILTCADIKAYKVADIMFNSSSTMASRLGLSKTVTLWNENNGKLIPGMKTHMENGHFVDHCTRKDRIKPKPTTSAVESDQIKIADYSLIADPGETKDIEIKSLPAGYTVSDLTFVSDKPEIASVDGLRVTAQKEGSAIITIKTSDGKYSVKLTMLVRSKQT